MRFLRNILILLTMIALAGYLIFAVVYTSPLPDGDVCRRIETRVLDADGLGFINEKDVQNQLGRMNQKYIGTQIGKIDFNEIETLIKKNPFVCEASCYYTADGAIRIDVTQRRPKFRVMTAYGNFYIDEQRQRMPTSTRFSVYVPVVTGIVNDDFLCGALYDFVDEIEDDDFWRSQITQIRVMPKNELQLTPRVGNHVICLGTLDGADEKLEKLRTFYRKGLPYIGWNRYRVIDLRYKNQVVCTKKSL